MASGESNGDLASTPAGASAKQPGLGLLTLTCLVVANMIGAGVYTSSGFALADLQSRWLVMAVWLLAGLFAMLGALCYGGLAKQITASGGEYLFLARAVHPFAGFMAGWISLTAGFSGAIAFSAVTFAAYCPAAWTGENPLVGSWIAVGLILFFGGCHLAGMSFGARVQNSLVAIKVLCLLAFVIYGTAIIGQQGPTVAAAAVATETLARETVTGSAAAAISGFSLAAFATSLMWISFSYAGYNAAVYVAGAARSGVTVARSMWLATAVVTMLYICLNGVILFGSPPAALTGQPNVFQIAAKVLGGDWLASAITVVVLLSLATSVSAMLQVGPHVYAQMARDGLLPSFLSVGPRELPRAATVLQIGLAVALTVFADLQALLDYLAFLLMLSSAATVSILLVPHRLWRHQPETAGQAKLANGQNAPAAIRKQVWGWPFTPLLFVLISLVIAMLALQFRWQTEPRGLLLALIVLPVGAFVYFVSRLTSGSATRGISGVRKE